MPGLLSIVGFPDRTNSEFKAVWDQTLEYGETTITSSGTYYKWKVGQHIEVWVKMGVEEKSSKLCPYFFGEARARVGLTQRAPRKKGSTFAGAFLGLTKPRYNESEVLDGALTFTFDVPEYNLYDAVTLPTVANVQLTAFAQSITAYASEAEFMEAQEPDPFILPGAFIPSTYFPAEGENDDDVGEEFPPFFDPEEEILPAKAIIAGHVMDSAIITNPVTEIDFSWAKVRVSLGEIDVIASLDSIEGFLGTGGMVMGYFWLAGRLIDEFNNP
jgi:hypothetical protein